MVNINAINWPGQLRSSKKHNQKFVIGAFADPACGVQESSLMSSNTHIVVPPSERETVEEFRIVPEETVEDDIFVHLPKQRTVCDDSLGGELDIVEMPTLETDAEVFAPKSKSRKVSGLLADLIESKGEEFQDRVLLDEKDILAVLEG